MYIYVCLCTLFRLLSVVQDVIVVDIHQDGEWLANNERDPHCSVAVGAPQEATSNPG